MTDLERVSEESAPKGYTYSAQTGTPGHCFMAQVWKPDGTGLVEIESTQDPEEATTTARRIAASLNACAGISTEALEKGPAVAELIRESGSVAEMVEALRETLSYLAHGRVCMTLNPTEQWEERGSWSPDNCRCVIAKVHAALAKVGKR